MAATKTRTRYNVPAIGDTAADSRSTKASAVALADKLADLHGIDIDVTTDSGNVVYTAKAADVIANSTDVADEPETETETLDEIPADLGEESQVAPDEDDDDPRAECGCLISDLVLKGEHSEDCPLMQPEEDDTEDAAEVETETETVTEIPAADDDEQTTEEILANLPESSDIDPTPEELAAAEAEIVADLAEKGIEITPAPAAEEPADDEEDEEDEPLVGGVLDFSEITFTGLLLMSEDAKHAQHTAAKAEWKRRMDIYDASMRTKKGERLVGPAMCIALETGASRANGNMLDVDGRARYALIQRGLIDATYEEQGSKRVLVKAVINAKGRAAIWR